MRLSRTTSAFIRSGLSRLSLPTCSQIPPRSFFRQATDYYTFISGWIPDTTSTICVMVNEMTKGSTDRRIKERFPASCLTVQLRERGFFGRGKHPIAVTCLDLNRYGMAVLCPRPVDAGVRLFLKIQGKYINEPRVSARVVACEPYQTGFRVSMQFSYCLDKNGYSRSVDNALSRIEGFYNRFAS